MELDGGPTFTLTTNGAGSALYHTHEILYNPTNGTASYLFDGAVLTNNWPASAVASPAGRIAWVAGSSSGQGQMTFNRVTFSITNTAVASYDAGTNGNPAIAPDPATQGWTLSPAPPPDGTAVTDVSPDAVISFVQTTIPGLVAVYAGSVAWGDFDNDGRLDFLLAGRTGSARVSQLWRNTGSGFVNATFPGLTQAESGSLAWGDYDNDGRLDFLFTGNSSVGHVSQIWRNLGGGEFVPASIVPPGLPGVSSSSVAWGDYDNDGRLDFLLTGVSGSFVSQVWRNTGSGLSNVTASVAPGLPGVWQSSVAWGDYDNDGRLDFLLTGNTGSTNVSQLWRNTGSGFTNVTASVAPGLPGVSRGSVAWGDYDNDGRLDFLLTGNTGSAGVSQLWRNTGSGFTLGTIAGLPGVFGSSVGSWVGSSVAWGDYDNDGRLDFLITGTTDGTSSGAISQLWRNNLPLSNAPPTAPTGLAAAFAGPNVALTWNPAGDAETPTAGLTYNLRVGSSPGASDVIAPTSLADGRRLLPQSGGRPTLAFLPQPGQTYYWSVQAVDTAFAGSPFSVERSFTVAPFFALTDGTPVFGDTNGDRVVDQNELNTVLNNYWQTSPPNMESVVSPSNTVFRFNLENLSSLNFHVLASTNVALPLMNWTDIGAARLRYEFTDPDATNYPARFYQLVWP